MKQKFSLKKFQKDRNKSLEGSRKGDWKLIDHNEGRDNIIEIIADLHQQIEPVKCEHLNVGCELVHWKRDMPKCEECYYR